MVKITRTCFLGHYLLRYDMMRVREAEKTSELRILQGPQKYVYCGKRSAGSCIARRMVKITLQTDTSCPRRWPCESSPRLPSSGIHTCLRTGGSALVAAGGPAFALFHWSVTGRRLRDIASEGREQRLTVSASFQLLTVSHAILLG